MATAPLQSIQKIENFPDDFVFVQDIVKETVSNKSLAKVGLFRDMVNNRTCAIKKTEKSKFSQLQIDTIKALLDLMKDLKSRFIVEYYAFIQTPKHLYLVMEHLPLGTLRSKISPKLPLKEEVVKFYVACMVLALEYLHCKNIVHGDMNTNNVALDSNGYAKLIDFDSAKLVPTIHPFLFDDMLGLSGTMQDLLIGEHLEAVDIKSLGDKISEAASSVLLRLSLSDKSYNKDNCRMCLGNVSDCEFFKEFNWYSLRDGTMQAPEIVDIPLEKPKSNTFSRFRRYS